MSTKADLIEVKGKGLKMISHVGWPWFVDSNNYSVGFVSCPHIKKQTLVASWQMSVCKHSVKILLTIFANK